MTENTQEKQNKNKAIIILLVILLLFSGGLSYWQFKQYQALQNELATKDLSIQSITSEKDSLSLMLDDLEAKLKQLETERAELADHNDNLESEIAKLQKTITSLRGQVAKANPADLARLKKEIEEISRKANNYEYELNLLKLENEELRKMSSELSEENKTLSVLAENLDSKVKKASAAQYGPLKVLPGRDRKSGYAVESKLRRIEEIRFEIDVIENPIVSSASDQEIKIRIIDPEKKVLTKLENNTKLVDKSEIYTIKHLYSFDGNAKKITLSFVPETKLIKGNYKVEFWAENQLKQTKSFEIE